MDRAGFAALVRSLGGDLYAGGSRALVPGPGHGPADRSVSLLLSRGRVVAHSFAGDDWRSVRTALVAHGLRDDLDPDLRLRPPRDVLLMSGPSREVRIATARGLWDAAGPTQGTLSADYLRRRGVSAAPEALRHHPGAPSAIYLGRGALRPAMLARVTSAAGDLAGVEVTYLTPQGDRARVASPRKLIGSCPAGAAVRLAPGAESLLVAEGVFSALSASERFDLPAWALLSAHNLRRWRAPAAVRFVVIAADRGRVGEAAALDLAGGLRGQGVRGVIRWPPAPHADWNDAVRAAQRSEEE